MTASSGLVRRNLAAAAAQALFIEHHALRYTISDKFDTDHMMVANLSKQTSIEHAVERYKRARRANKPPAMRSSWINISPQTVLNKVGPAPKRASVHTGKQQLTTAITVKRRTVDLSELTRVQVQRVSNAITITISPREVYYLSASSAEATVTLLVVGKWAPVTGAVELYHYEEAALTTVRQAMLPAYLAWYHNAQGAATAPVATR